MNRVFAPYPANRPRRLRRDAATRALVREHRLAPEDLILPVFVLDGSDRVQDVPSMPGVRRMSVDRLFAVAEECLRLGVPVLALFPVIDAALKTPDGAEATNPEGLVPRAVQAGMTADGGGLVINSSRGILYAGSGEDFAAAARRATLELRDAVEAARR